MLYCIFLKLQITVIIAMYLTIHREPGILYMFNNCVTIFVAIQNDCLPNAHLNYGDCILFHSSFIRVSNLFFVCYVCTYACICMHACMHACMYVCTYVYVCM